MQTVSLIPTHMVLPTSAYFLGVKDTQLGLNALESLLCNLVAVYIHDFSELHTSYSDYKMTFMRRCYDDHLKLSTQLH